MFSHEAHCSKISSVTKKAGGLESEVGAEGAPHRPPGGSLRCSTGRTAWYVRLLASNSTSHDLNVLRFEQLKL